MALRTMKATRLKALNCRFRAYAGDTVSHGTPSTACFISKIVKWKVVLISIAPWLGMGWELWFLFQHRSGCYLAWWFRSRRWKIVLMNCRFDGYDGFMLGRYHRDAQFYLVNCSFAKNMKDTAIYRVPTSNVIQWGLQNLLLLSS